MSFAESWLKLWEAWVRPLGTNNLHSLASHLSNSLRQSLDYERPIHHHGYEAIIGVDEQKEERFTNLYFIGTKGTRFTWIDTTYYVDLF